MSLGMTIVMGVMHDRARAERFAHRIITMGDGKCWTVQLTASRPAARGAGMRVAMIFTELAARNLREAILRNSLTTLGIAVGVASFGGDGFAGRGLAGIGQHAAFEDGAIRRDFRDVPRQPACFRRASAAGRRIRISRCGGWMMTRESN